MWKRILGALLVVILAVAADAVHQAAARAAGDSFNLQMGALLFNIRPVIFLIWYLVLLTIARWFMGEQSRSPVFSIFLIIIGLAIVSMMIIPSWLSLVSRTNFHVMVSEIMSSRLALTAHSGAFLIAIGVILLLWRPAKTNT